MSTWKTFMTSFLDGYTGVGIFSDLRRPGAPDMLFEEDEPEHVPAIKEDGENDERAGLQGPAEKS
jgi:hypothetical protein